MVASEMYEKIGQIGEDLTISRLQIRPLSVKQRGEFIEKYIQKNQQAEIDNELYARKVMSVKNAINSVI